jgi:HAMP domain-containing protein
VTLAFGGEILIAGLVAQFISAAFPRRWGSQTQLQPSPAERSIETRFIAGTGTIISLLLITLLVGDWIVAGRAARNLLKDRLESSAQLASQNVPFILETGQNLIQQIANDARLQEANADLTTILAERLQSIPYFNQLVVIDLSSHKVIAAYPIDSKFEITRPEEDGLTLVQQGVPNQIYTIPPTGEEEAAGTSFLAAIPQTQHVLIGRMYLGANPYTRSLINNLNSLSEIDGTGLLIADGVIVYDSQKMRTWSSYDGESGDQATFFDETASLGTRQLVYYQPVDGHPWAVVLTIPAQAAQQLAIDIALPISLMIVLLGIVTVAFMSANLRAVTSSLQNLATEAKYLSTGKLDRPLNVNGDDEISELRRRADASQFAGALAGFESSVSCQPGSSIESHAWGCIAPCAGGGYCQWRKFGAHYIDARYIPNHGRHSLAFCRWTRAGCLHAPRSPDPSPRRAAGTGGDGNDLTQSRIDA